MPTHSYTLKAGTTSKVFLVHVRAGGEGRSALRHDTPGVTAAYVREGEGGVHVVPLTLGRVGSWSAGGFVEVDPDLLPGVYQVGIPNEMLAPGSTRAVLVLRCPGVEIDPVDVDLVAFDPQDPIRLGMSALGPEGRVAALRGAFPRLAQKEIEEQQAMLDGDADQ
jgi:hypothetical protein